MEKTGGEEVTTTVERDYVDSWMCDGKQEIKSEPPVDIDDMSNDNNEASKPKIRLTPTIKLMATPVPSDNLIKKERKISINNDTSDYQGHPYLSSSKVEGKKKFVCPYENCEKSYGKSSHLRSHLTWHTGIKPFVCHEPSCGKGFTRSDELNRHTRTHTGEKPFECVQCTKKFSRSDHLSKHLVTHAKQMANGTINIQKPAPKTETTLKTSTSETLPAAACLPTYACNTETIATSSDYGQSEALDVKPNIVPNGSVVNLATTEFSNGELNVPTIIPNVEMKEEIIDDYNEENNDDKIMPEANAPPMVVPLLTTTSTRMAGSVTKLVNLERPYPCDSCEKAFRRQDDLTRHRRTHTGEKPYACKECDRRFMRNDHLKKHMSTHLRGR